MELKPNYNLLKETVEDLAEITLADLDARLEQLKELLGLSEQEIDWVITPSAKAEGFSLSGSSASATLSRRASRDWVPTLSNPRAI